MANESVQVIIKVVIVDVAMPMYVNVLVVSWAVNAISL